MAKGRIRSRMELREQYEAAEAREREERKDGESDQEDAGDSGDGEGETKVAPKKKKPAKEPKPRKKTAKQVRRRLVWVVLDNSTKRIAQYDYNQRAAADEHAARLAAEKKSTYFVQPDKVEITE